MPKKKRNQKLPASAMKLHNSFQLPGTENPLDNNLTSKRIREEIVKQFLEDRDNNAKG
jgi:hypothetical protein